MAIVIKKHELDPRAVEYAALTDEQAKERVQVIKNRIKEIVGNAEISKDPRLMWELRELKSSLTWHRLNKNRSKFFRIDSVGPSMRQARRNPDGRSRRDKIEGRRKRKKVQASDTVLSGT